MHVQALADGQLAVRGPALHLAPVQHSLDHCLHGAVKHDDEVGGLARLGTREGGWVRKRLGALAPCVPLPQRSGI